MSNQLLQSTSPTEDAGAVCSFCSIFRDPTRRRDLDAALVEDDDFTAFASLGGFIEGWVLIAPRRHVISLAQLSLDESERFATFRTEVEATVQRNYGSTISFEHGPTGCNQPVGCSVDHAHLHIVPFHRSILPDLMAVSPSDTEWRPCADGSVDALERGERSYIHLRDFDGREWTGFSEKLPSQLVRRVLRQLVVGDDCYDWRRYPCVSTVYRTIARLT